MMHEYLFNYLTPIFAWIFVKSVYATLLVLVLFIVRAVFRDRLDPVWRHAFWGGLVAVLLLPPLFSSTISIESGVTYFTAKPQPTDSVEITATPSRHHTPQVRLPQDFNAIAKPPISHIQPVETSDATIESIVVPQFEPIAFSTKKHTLTPFDVAACVWFGGGVILSIAMLLKLSRIRSVLVHAKIVTNNAVQKEFDNCRRIAGVKRRILLVESPSFRSPMLAGLFKPRIVIPSGILQNLDSTMLKHLFLHELAHWKRLDLLSGWVMSLLLILHWFNPMIWIAVRKMNEDREEATDFLVLAKLSDNERPDYGQSLINLARWKNGLAPKQSCSKTLFGSIGMLGITEPTSTLSRRIDMITKFKNFSIAVKLMFAVSTLLVTTFLLTGTPKAKLVAEDAPGGAVSESNETVIKSGNAAENSKHVSGRIRDEEGNPVQGATIIVQLWDGLPPINGVKQSPVEKCYKEVFTTSDTNGFYFVDIPQDVQEKSNVHVVIIVSHPDYLQHRIYGTPLSGGVYTLSLEGYANFTMIPVTAISGTVVDADLKPIHGALVSAEMFSGPLGNGNKGKSETGTGVDGKFTLKVYRDNSVILRIQPKTHAPVTTILNKKRGDLGTIQAKNGVILSGTLLDRHGKPLPKQWVQIYGPRDNAYSDYMFYRSALTNENGEYRFNPVEPGKYVLSVVASPMDPFANVNTNGFDTGNHGSDTKIIEQLKAELFEEPPKTYPVQDVFVQREIVIGSLRPEETYEIKADSSTALKFRILDTEGKPYLKQLDFHFYGKANGSVWNKYIEKVTRDTDGRFMVDVPRGIENGVVAMLSVGYEQYLALRYQLDDKPERIDWLIGFNDVKPDNIGEITVVPMKPAAVTIKSFNEEGEWINLDSFSVDYTGGTTDVFDGTYFMKHFGFSIDCSRLPVPEELSLEQMSDKAGEEQFVSWPRFAVLPYREFEITGKFIHGGEKVSQKHALWEGAEKTVQFTVKNDTSDDKDDYNMRTFGVKMRPIPQEQFKEKYAKAARKNNLS